MWNQIFWQPTGSGSEGSRILKAMQMSFTSLMMASAEGAAIFIVKLKCFVNGLWDSVPGFVGLVKIAGLALLSHSNDPFTCLYNMQNPPDSATWMGWVSFKLASGSQVVIVMICSCFFTTCGAHQIQQPGWGGSCSSWQAVPKKWNRLSIGSRVSSHCWTSWYGFFSGQACVVFWSRVKVVGVIL
jgi:hypothetical protein